MCRFDVPWLITVNEVQTMAKRTIDAPCLAFRMLATASLTVSCPPYTHTFPIAGSVSSIKVRILVQGKICHLQIKKCINKHHYCNSHHQLRIANPEGVSISK